MSRTSLFPHEGTIIAFSLAWFCLHLVLLAGVSEVVFDHWSNGNRLGTILAQLFPEPQHDSGRLDLEVNLFAVARPPKCIGFYHLAHRRFSGR